VLEMWNQELEFVDVKGYREQKIFEAPKLEFGGV